MGRIDSSRLQKSLFLRGIMIGVVRLFRITRRWCYRHARQFRLAGLGLLGMAILCVLVQLAYPSSRLRPNALIEGQSVGGKTVDQTAEFLQKSYQDATLAIQLGDAKPKASYTEIGITLDAQDAAKDAAGYPFWERLVPFSLFFPTEHVATGNFDDEKIEYYAKQLASKYSKAATNASIKINGDNVELVSAKPSQDFSAESIEKAIKNASLKVAATASVKPAVKEAARDNDAVKKAVDEAKKVIGTPVVLKVGNEKITVDKKTVASWLDFPENAETKQLELSVKQDAVRSYITTLQPKVYKAPGEVKVSLFDGQELSRTSGKTGTGLDLDGATTDITELITEHKSEVITLKTVAIPAKISYVREYSNTQAGLSALLGDIKKSGMSVSVIELGNMGRSANADGNKQYVAASTYKLFVAYAVIKKVEAGQMSWSDTISGSKNAEACFDAMIVVSDNPCAKAFGDKIGWQNIQNMMRDLGLSSTQLSPSLYTTTNDLAKYLQQLQNGSLLSASGTDRLLSAMKRQIYRSGIPAGTGATVANKVGFIDSYLHDAAIVYGPKGPYVLVIMSSGSSWSAISSVSGQINEYLNR